MKNILKYGLVPLVIGAFLLCVTVMLLPALINVQKFLPQIEKQVAEHTGRSFRVGSDFGLTFFPWLSLTFSDMHFGNPDGFESDDFLNVDSFEARVKLLPLLANKVEISRFVVSGLHLNLERNSSGKANWHFDPENHSKGQSSSDYSHFSWLGNRDVIAELFAVTGGSVVYRDALTGKSHSIHDLMVLINDGSFSSQSKAEFKGVVSNYQIKGSGSFGPFISQEHSLALDIDFTVDEKLHAMASGECSSPLTAATCELIVTVPKFNLVDIVSVDAESKLLDQTLEVKGDFSGGLGEFEVTSGTGSIDDSPFTFSLTHKHSSTPVTSGRVNFQKLDLGRYFTRDNALNSDVEGIKSWPLLAMVKDLSFSLEFLGQKLKVAELTLEDVSTQITAKDGSLKFSEGKFFLHGGEGSFDAEAGLYQLPASFEGSVGLSGVKADLLSGNLVGNQIIKGSLESSFDIKRSDNSFIGSGTVRVTDGSVKGLDLFSDETVGSTGATDFENMEMGVIFDKDIIGLNSIKVKNQEMDRLLNGAVQLTKSSFTLTPETKILGESISITGSYGADGLVVDGFTDVHETKIYEMRDAQTLVDEKMPTPVEDDVNDLVGTPLIDPAIVADRFGLKPDLIRPEKAKKSYYVGRGRVIIHDLKEVDGSVLAN